MRGTGAAIIICGHYRWAFKSAIGWLADCVTNVADIIRDFLHFSVPDKGPLTDYETLDAGLYARAG